MWIFWGTKAHQEPIGIVADLCPICENLQTLVITDHFKADHIQFVRTSGWVMVGTTRRCVVCQTERLCNKSSYTIIAPFVDEQLALADLLAKTNPRLEKALHEEARREILGADSKPPSDNRRLTTSGKHKRNEPAADPEVRELLDAISGEENDADIFKLKEKLKLWSRLNSAQRLELTDDVDEYRLKQRQLVEAKEFLMSMSLHFPSWAEKLGLLVALVLFGGWLTLISVVDEELRWYFILGGVPTILVLLIFCAMLFSYTVAEGWFRKTLLPRAMLERVAFDALLKLAKHPAQWNIDEWNAAAKIMSHRDLLATMVEMEMQNSVPSGTSFE